MTVSNCSAILLSIGAALIAVPSVIYANESLPPTAGETLTLASAVAEALAQSPALRGIEAEVDSARGEVLAAQARPPSELSVTPAWKRVREAEGTHHEFKGTIALNQTIVFPGKRELLVSIAERNVELRRLGLSGLRFQLAAAVRKTFYELLAAQVVLDLRRQQLDSALIFQAAALRRAQTGYASDFEAVKSQGEVITARKMLVAAEGAIAAARVGLNSLLGREPLAPLELAGSLADVATEPPLTELLAVALAENPSLRVQAMQAEVSSLNVRRARLARRLDFSVGPTLEYSKSEQVFGLGATVAMPGKGYGRGEILTATAEQRKVEAETVHLRREITGAVTKAATQLATARHQLALYTPAYLDQLRAVVAQAEQSYAQNGTSLLIYLDAKRTYFDTLADYYAAVADVATSRAALESAVGVPLESKSSNPSA